MGCDRCGVPARLGWHIVSGDAVGEWVAARVDGHYSKEIATAIGLERDGNIIAGVIYENWNRRSIVCHIAVEGRLTPGFIAAIFDYPFNVCAVEKVISPVGSGNTKSQRLATSMGYVEEARIKDAHPDGDLILYTLKRSDCRFLGENYGKKRTKPTTST